MPRAAIIPFMPKPPPSRELDARPVGMPLSELYAHFIERKAKHDSRGSLLNHTACARRVREMRLAEHPEPLEVLTWLGALKSVYSASTVDLQHDLLGAVYSWGNDMALVRGNPVAVCGHRKAPRRPKNTHDVEGVWTWVTTQAGLTERELGFLAMQRYAAARRSEVLGLHFDDFFHDGEGWSVTIERQRPNPGKWETTATKSRKPRTVPIDDACVPFIVPLLQAGPVVVRTGLGGGGEMRVPFVFPLRVNDLLRLKGKLSAHPLWQQRGVANHVLRHSRVYEWASRMKADVKAIQKGLGHVSLKSTDTYMSSFIGERVERSALCGPLAPRPVSLGALHDVPGVAAVAAAAQATRRATQSALKLGPLNAVKSRPVAVPGAPPGEKKAPRPAATVRGAKKPVRTTSETRIRTKTVVAVSPKSKRKCVSL